MVLPWENERGRGSLKKKKKEETKKKKRKAKAQPYKLYPGGNRELWVSFHRYAPFKF